MASTPLFKSLKPNGTSFYAFPGAAEDISAAYQNDNYKMYFSKYVLLNFPKQNTIPSIGGVPQPVYFDFDESFAQSPNATPTVDFSESIVESLRNYVANQETVIRESRLNNTEYFYNTNALETTSEKIFWKWCKKLGVIDFEPAVPEDEFFSTLTEFESRDLNNDEFFPEFLWKEREVNYYETVSFTTVDVNINSVNFLNRLQIEFTGTTNFRVGDLVNINNVTNPAVSAELTGYTEEDGLNVTVLQINIDPVTQVQTIVFDVQFEGSGLTSSGFVNLVYDRLVQYVGEVNGVSNVQEANRSYTEVYANIPDHTGQTPDILFRTIVDENYSPNLTFPIIPNQIQPEIMGAELFNSPIVSNPQNYPGSYFGQFDTLNYTYETETGDSLRRSGRYFGVRGDINNPIVDGSTIDGVTVDFNTSHYVKMNLPRKVITNFDQFNALTVDNNPPKDFEFNAILWYYTVEGPDGTQRTNLYGISFFNNPNNNPVDDEIGLRFPTYKKLVSNGQQDGTAYQFSLNLNFNIINENTIDAYNPEAINSLFSMNLFNEAMRRLSSINSSFLQIISENQFVREEIQNLKSLLYTQTDINVLNTKISNLETLLRLYSTMQIVDSESISVSLIPGNPPTLSLNNIDTQYVSIDTYLTSNMYNAQGVIPITVGVPQNKNFLIRILNNDEVNFTLPNEEKLTLVLSRDLYLRQSVDFLISANEFSSQNKRLDIFMVSDVTGNPTENLIVGDIELPIFYNPNTQLQNQAYQWKDFKFEIDLSQDIILQNNGILDIPFSGNTFVLNNSINSGDVLYLNNFFVGTSSVFNFSGQYVVDSLIGVTSSYVRFDVSSNSDLVAYAGTNPVTIHTATSSQLSNLPYFSLNKGKKIKLTRVSNSNVLSERYNIQIDDIL